ncbi:MAG: hypothetical protein L7F78_25825, partial [Syntrophales bacterium LBB04]|nr:hypothetical protein [Syntrophales bacterium LBB04]
MGESKNILKKCLFILKLQQYKISKAEIFPSTSVRYIVSWCNENNIIQTKKEKLIKDYFPFNSVLFSFFFYYL